MAPPGLGCSAQVGRVLIQVPCKQASHSQCSVHKLPWCPSLPGRLRQSNTVGYSMHGYLSGVQHEMKHQEKRSPFTKSFGNTLSTLIQVLLRDHCFGCFCGFLHAGRKPVFICYVLVYTFYPSSGNCCHQGCSTQTRRQKIKIHQSKEWSEVFTLRKGNIWTGGRRKSQHKASKHEDGRMNYSPSLNGWLWGCNLNTAVWLEMKRRLNVYLQHCDSSLFWAGRQPKDIVRKWRSFPPGGTV